MGIVKCQRCGGSLILGYGDLYCINCGYVVVSSQYKWSIKDERYEPCIRRARVKRAKLSQVRQFTNWDKCPS